MPVLAQEVAPPRRQEDDRQGQGQDQSVQAARQDEQPHRVLKEEEHGEGHSHEVVGPAPGRRPGETGGGATKERERRVGAADHRGDGGRPENQSEKAIAPLSCTQAEGAGRRIRGIQGAGSGNDAQHGQEEQHPHDPGHEDAQAGARASGSEGSPPRPPPRREGGGRPRRRCTRPPFPPRWSGWAASPRDRATPRPAGPRHSRGRWRAMTVAVERGSSRHRGPSRTYRPSGRPRAREEARPRRRRRAWPQPDRHSERRRRPRPQPATFPTLNTRPPGATRSASTTPSPGTRAFATSWPRFAPRPRTHHTFTCTTRSTRTETRIANAKLARAGP